MADEVNYNQPKDGITSRTPKTIIMDAGTIHKGLVCKEGQWNFKESLWFATGDGNKLTIEPEITDLEVDGAWVKVKQLQVKTGESATMEVTPVEITGEVLSASLIGDETESEEADGFTVLKSREIINEGDYVENLAYVGTRIDGTPIIVRFPNALCTSGLSLEGSNKEKVVPSLTFECMAELEASHRTLPYEIYYPTEDAAGNIETLSASPAKAAAKTNAVKNDDGDSK